LERLYFEATVYGIGSISKKKKFDSIIKIIDYFLLIGYNPCSTALTFV